jgi:hypothetical protein
MDDLVQKREKQADDGTLGRMNFLHIWLTLDVKKGIASCERFRGNLLGKLGVREPDGGADSVFSMVELLHACADPSSPGWLSASAISG